MLVMFNICARKKITQFLQCFSFSKTLVFKSNNSIPLGKDKACSEMGIPEMKKALIRDAGNLYPNFTLIHYLGEKKPFSKLKV